MSFLFKNLLILSMIFSISISHAEGKPSGLTKNPFKRPAHSSDIPEPSFTATNGQSLEIDLRAAMSAGENSLINIGGTIVRIGEEIKGYRLLAVQEDKVIFSRNNALVTVYLKQDQVGN